MAHCAYAYDDTLVGSSEGEWDATDGRNGGAQQMVWAILFEMEWFEIPGRRKNQGAAALVLDLANAFERVSFPVVLAWATHFNFPRKIWRVLCGYLEHPRRVQFEGCVAEPLQTITAIQPGSKCSCFLLRRALQDALLRLTVDDITALLMGRNQELVEMTEKVLRKLQKEVGGEGLEAVDH